LEAACEPLDIAADIVGLRDIWKVKIPNVLRFGIGSANECTMPLKFSSAAFGQLNSKYYKLPRVQRRCLSRSLELNEFNPGWRQLVIPGGEHLSNWLEILEHVAQIVGL
jgi:hypothetical protein